MFRLGRRFAAALILAVLASLAIAETTTSSGPVVQLQENVILVGHHWR
jgi:hypothetical protein